MRSDSIDCRSLDDLQITQGSKIQAQILQGVGGLVDKENIYSELVNTLHSLDQSEGEADRGGCRIRSS